jgi:segregation and condensation protein A
MTTEAENHESEAKKAQQEQIHSLLFNREIGWQEIIYDLINTEQLDPWNIDLIILTNKFLEKIREIEEADFFVSSKVLLAATLLLKIKSEILLDKYIKSIDEILFGREEKKKTVLERIELDEEIPELIPKVPMPRFRRVTLQELIDSLNKAITTENRRIKKEVISSSALHEAEFFMERRRFNIKDKIKDIYSNLFSHFKKNNEKTKVSYTEFIGDNKEERIMSFLPLIHLENQKKILLEQPEHFEEIYIWLREVYLQHNPDPLDSLKKELQEQMEKEIEKDEKKKKRLEKTNKDFANPLGDM